MMEGYPVVAIAHLFPWTDSVLPTSGNQIFFFWRRGVVLLINALGKMS